MVVIWVYIPPPLRTAFSPFLSQLLPENLFTGFKQSALMYKQPVSHLQQQVQAVDRGAQWLGQLSGLAAVQIQKQAAAAHNLTPILGSLEQTLKEVIQLFFIQFGRGDTLFQCVPSQNSGCKIDKDGEKEDSSHQSNEQQSRRDLSYSWLLELICCGSLCFTFSNFKNISKHCFKGLFSSFLSYNVIIANVQPATKNSMTCAL